jgi:hypothetical protein
MSTSTAPKTSPDSTESSRGAFAVLRRGKRRDATDRCDPSPSGTVKLDRRDSERPRSGFPGRFKSESRNFVSGVARRYDGHR